MTHRLSFKDYKPLPTEIITGMTANYSMTHLINMMGKNIIYLETGVNKGSSISAIVQRCPNIAYAIGIDFYEPHIDEFEKKHLQEITKEKVTNAFSRAKHRIRASGHKDKVELILEHTRRVAPSIKNESIDFVFLDHYINSSDVEEACYLYYNKVKKGGYFAGHDYVYKGVSEPINRFREDNSITSPLSVFGAEWVWKKEENICI